MSERDDEIQRAIQLISRCDTATLVRFADDLEDSLEFSLCATLPLPETDGHTLETIDALREAYD